MPDVETAKIKTPHPKTGENTYTDFTLKVPYGYNFADNNFNVKGETSNHGIHVGGIVGANATDKEVEDKTGIDGVASDVQLLAMKVFSNDPNKKGASDDDIIAAIEASVEKKADIINMSLGSPSGFMNDDDPMQRAVNAAVEAGVLVVVAAGNDTAAFAENGFSTKVENLIDYKDVGLVGSPSTARGALSVASYENTHKFIHLLTYQEKGQAVKKPYNLTQGVAPKEEVSLVHVGLGEEKDFTNDKQDLSGKIALVERGKISFGDKLKNAIKHKATGILVYNNGPEQMAA